MDITTIYSIIDELEKKRFLGAMDDASNELLEFDHSQASTDQALCINSKRSVHMLAKLSTNFFWNTYISPLSDILHLHTVDKNNQLVEDKTKRSKFETYTAALRAITNDFRPSFLSSTVVPSLGLEGARDRVLTFFMHLQEFLKYAERHVAWLERYMTWLGHGAELAYKFRNAQNEDDELEDNDGSAEDYLVDERVKAYALLKASNINPREASEFMENFSLLLANMVEFISIGHRLYLSLEPQHMEFIFNALSSKSGKTANSQATDKFRHLHDLNTYIRDRVEDSVDSADGFIYNVSEVLDTTVENYISELSVFISDLLVFLPDKASQKQFISQFESGKLWRDKQD